MAAQGQRTGLIKTIANLPVEEKFFGVALVLLDGFLGVLAGKSTGTQQALLVLAVIFVFLVVVILVWWMRMDQRRRAHAQTLVDSLTEHDKFAEGLADDICEAFEGSLRNDKYTTEADRELPQPTARDCASRPVERRSAEVLRCRAFSFSEGLST